MYKLVVKHSCIMVNDYSIGDLPSTEKFFSIWDPNRHTSYTLAIYYDTEKRILYLPRGISITRLERNLNTQAFVDSKHDPIASIGQVMLKYMPRDEVQEIGMKFLIGVDNYKFTKNKSQLSVNLSPGDGKTYLAVATMAYYGYRTAMITSNKNWIDQWEEKIQEYTDITKNEIYRIEGKASIEKLYNGMHDINQYKFILCSHKTITSYANSNGWEAVHDLFKYMGIGIKIYDEAHVYFENICYIDFFTDTYRTIYLTATPARSDSKQDKIYQQAFASVPALNLFDDKKDPRTHYVAFHYNSRPSPVDIERCRSAYGFSANVYIDYVIRRDNFYKLLFILLEIAKTKGKTLIYIGKIEAINIVYGWIMYNFPELYGNVGIINSSISPEVKDIEKNKMIILSTIKSCGTAMDIQGLKLTINLANPFASKVLSIQTLGRTRDYNTMYIDVVDVGFAALKRYYKHKQGIFSMYALSFKDVILHDDVLDEKYRGMFKNKQDYYSKLYSKGKNVVMTLK